MKSVKSSVEIMTRHEMQMIHDTALKILSEIGIKTPNKEVLHMCEEWGAVIDWQREVVKIPAALMELHIEKVKAASNYDYDGAAKNKLGASISTQVFYYDYQTKSRRYGLMNDVMKGIKLVEKLENFYSNSAIVIPSDIPPNFTDVASFHTIYSYAGKGGGTYILTATGAKYIVEMSRALGRDVGYFLETVSPLQFRKESLEMALVMSKMGCGIGIGPMVVGGTLGPITTAGNCALQTAEILGSMFVSTVLTKNFSHGYGSYNHTADMRTMLCSFGSPNQALLGIAAAQMGRFYGLWSCSNNGLTDSLLPDYQCGMEKASNALFALLAGCGGMGAMGIVGADQGISLEQLVLDNEFINTYNYVMSGFDVNEESLAFDVLKEVGIAGNFTAEPHTAEHIHDSYFDSSFMNRLPFDSWNANGKVSAFDKAHTFVEEVTKGYEKMEPVISPAQYEEITRIRDEAAADLNKELK